MKTTFNLVDILWGKLKASPLATAINGGIYKYRRPINSRKEDVLINCLPVDNNQMQQAIANVNIHVPNQVHTLNGAVDDSQPNHVRLSELADLAIAALTDVWAEDYNFDVQQQILFSDDEANDHYINIRIEFNNINLSN